MNPSIAMRLQSMISAMSEVVIPAIASSGGVVLEQAGLVLGHLHMLQQQYDFAHRFERLELAAGVRLGGQLLVLAGAVPAMQAATANLTAALDAVTPDVGDDPEQIRQLAERVNAAIEELIDASANEDGKAFFDTCKRPVIDHGIAVSQWNRSWVAAANFEVDQPRLLPIPEMIRQFSEDVSSAGTFKRNRPFDVRTV